MRVSFRQGIVRYQHPEFLTVSGTSVSLLASTTPLVLTMAHGHKDYLWIETTDVPNAWTGIVPGINQWLYVDIDVRSGQRTFGTTSLLPIVSNLEPVNPNQGQHWFDTNLNLMKVWDVYAWDAKIRVFVCLLDDGSVLHSVSDNLAAFDGTQISNYEDVNSGLILFDGTTHFPIKDNNGDFITSEDQMFTTSTTDAPIKVESVILQAIAATNLPIHTVVKFSDFGVIHAADENVTRSYNLFGIIQEAALQGHLVSITTRGIVSSNLWDWSSLPINAPLYVGTSGQLQTVPVFAFQVPAATVIDVQTIDLGSPQVIANTITNPPMTTTTLGIGKISVPSVDPQNPIVVGDNDPRLSDTRTPNAHTHTIAESIGLQTALDAKLNLSGGTMTGALLVLTPTANSHAATKLYVDSRRINDLSSVTITALAANDMLLYNGTAWVNTPIPSSNIALTGDVSGSGTTAAPINVTLTPIVLAGTGTKISYDDKGRVVNSTTLSPLDIPGLDWSKITSGIPTTLGAYGVTDVYTKTEVDNHNWTWSHITTTPTSLAGYGILDAYTKTATNLLTWNWSAITSTPTTTAGYGITDAIINASGTPSIYQNTAPPLVPATGQLFVDTINNKIQRYTGTGWVDLSGYPITLSGDVTGSGTSNISVTLNTVPISKGGTGATTASAAINSLLPVQALHGGHYLTTDGAIASWAAVPTVTTITGNAGSATVLQTARNIAVSGDITGSVSFNGSANVTIASTLATVNPTTFGTFGSASQTPVFTVNNKGLITSASQVSIVPTAVAWNTITTTPTTLAGYGITDATPSSHLADFATHLTSLQNTWIDAITASSTEVNYLVGTTSAVQTQLNSKLALTGGTMTGSITMSAETTITLPTPAAGFSASHAVNKAYVDGLSTGLVWIQPVLDPNLVADNLNSPPVATSTEIYIVGGAPTGAWVGLAGHAVFWNGTGWTDLLGRAVATGDRFAVAAEFGAPSVSGGLIGHVNNIAVIVSNVPGAITYTFTAPTVNQAFFINQTTSAHFGHSYTYTSGAIWIEFSGPSNIAAGIGLYFTGSTLNVRLGAGIAEIPTGDVGVDLYAAGGLYTTLNGIAASTDAASQLAIKLDGTTLTLSGAGIRLSTTGVIAGTYTSVTTDTYGRITGGTSPTTLLGYGITDAYTKTEVDNHNWTWSHITTTPTTLFGYGILDAYTKTEVDNHNWTWSHITTTPTTLAGYGITDAQPLDADLTAIAALTGTAGFLKTSGAGIWSVDTSTYLTSNQTITLSGDATGTGTTSIAVTLNTVPISKGGTGATTAPAAINALLPAQTTNSGKFLSTDGTNVSWVAQSGSGSGTTTNVLTIGSYLTGGSFNGSVPVTIAADADTNNTASKLVARDVSGNFSAGTITATLNGNATNVTGTVAIANGGTGQTSANAALNALLPSQATFGGKFLTTDGTNTAWATVSGGGTPGGTNTQIQYNSNGVFGGASGLTTDGTNLTIGGNLIFSGTSRRITGDFTNSTSDLRTSFQTSTTNGVTYVNAWPNGSGNSSAWIAYATSATNSAPYVMLQATTTEAIINSAALTLGTPQPISFKINGTTYVQIPNSGFNAVNYLTLAGSQTGNPVTIGSGGTDANVPVLIDPKGTGNVQMTAPNVSFGNGNFATAGDAVSKQYILRQTTTNATLTEMFLDGTSARMTLANNTTWKFQVNIVGRCTTTANNRIAITLDGCIDQAGTAASTVVVGSVMKTIVAKDVASWDANADADITNGALRIQVTGETAKTIKWVAFVRTVEVTG